MYAQKIMASLVSFGLLVTSFSIYSYEMTETHHNALTNVTTKYTAQRTNNLLESIVEPYKTVSVDPEQLRCMITNMYFEAGNQKSDEAIAAVGYTVLNRVNDKHYPNTVCGVVYQGKRNKDGSFVRNRCQFSWVCDSRPNSPTLKNSIERAAWLRVEIVAMQVMTGIAENPIGNSTMYHATYVRPYWVSAFKFIAKVGDHKFYARA